MDCAIRKKVDPPGYSINHRKNGHHHHPKVAKILSEEPFFKNLCGLRAFVVKMLPHGCFCLCKPQLALNIRLDPLEQVGVGLEHVLDIVTPLAQPFAFE